MKFLLATRNQGKLGELQAVLSDLEVTLVTLAEFGTLPDVVEDQPSFAENSRKKALHYFKLTGLPAIADDSGLEVDALNGRPGVFSARYAPTDDLRIDRLLTELREVGSKNRRCRFVCAICAVLNEDEVIEAEGDVEGEVLEKRRGHGGFGYDPVFLYPQTGESFAEMSSEKKNSVSHRAVALQRFKVALSQRLTGQDDNR